MPVKLTLNRFQTATLLRDREFVLRCVYLGYSFGVIETFLNSGLQRTRDEIASDADFLGYHDSYFLIGEIK